MIDIPVLIAMVFSLQGCSHKSASVDQALVIGISTNQDKSNIAADVEAFGKALPCNPGGLRIVTSNVEQLTRANLLSELRQFASQTHHNDIAWLMIEGYGEVIDGENYFYTSDSERNNGKSAKETLIGMRDIMQALNKMQAKSLIITLSQTNDSTQSHLYGLNIPLSGSPWNTNWKVPSGISSVVAFYCSVSGQNTVIGPTTDTPYFTYFLKKGLTGGAANKDGKVKLKNLLSYVQLGVGSNILFYGGNVNTCTWSVAGEDKTTIMDTILTKSLRSSLGGKSSVHLPMFADDEQRYEAAMLRAFELKIKANQKSDKAATSTTWLRLDRFNFAPVRKQFLKALQFKPDSPRAFYELGGLEVKMGEVDIAQKHLMKAMRLAPKSYLPIWGLANLMQKEKKYQNAENLYKRAIQISPSNPVIKYDLSTLYLRTRETNKAKKILQEITTEYPTWGTPLSALSYISYVEGNKAKGWELLLRAHKLSPDDNEILYKLARQYCYEHNDYQQATQLYSRLIVLFPSNGLYRKEFAECLLLQNKIKQAKQQANKALELGWPSNDPLFKKLKIK